MKQRRINSGDKGNRTARNLCKLLASRFGQPFERTVGSGNRWAQVKGLSSSSKDVLIGDVVCPDGFRFVLECKGGYEDKIDFHSILADGNATVDGFISQVVADAERSGRHPLLIYKRNLRKWMAFVPTALLPDGVDFGYRLVYRDWSIVSLARLLEAPDAYFFGDAGFEGSGPFPKPR